MKKNQKNKNQNSKDSGSNTNTSNSNSNKPPNWGKNTLAQNSSKPSKGKKMNPPTTPTRETRIQNTNGGGDKKYDFEQTKIYISEAKFQYPAQEILFYFDCIEKQKDFSLKHPLEEVSFALSSCDDFIFEEGCDSGYVFVDSVDADRCVGTFPIKGCDVVFSFSPPTLDCSAFQRAVVISSILYSIFKPFIFYS